MKKLTQLLTAILVFLCACPAPAQKSKTQSLYSRENLVAWCIVPFDKMKRTPEARAIMLKDLGLTQFAYDWRQEHLPEMETEIKTLRKHNITLKSVWFWVDGGSGEYLDKNNEFILKTLKENDVRTELWLSFNDRFSLVSQTAKSWRKP